MPSHHSSSSHSSSSHHSSSHSSSSHSSVSHSGYSPHSGSSRSGSVASAWVYRPTRNQPKGYRYTTRSYCGTRHNYTYYGQPWTHEGVEYQAGYYDENGDWYRDVAFVNRGSTILYSCPYCGTETKLANDYAGPLSCPNCNGSLTKVSEVDELICDDTELGAGGSKGFDFRKVIILLACWFIIIGMINTVFGIFLGFARGLGSNKQTVSNVDIYGREIYLERVSKDAYVITEDKEDSDKTLKWDYGADSYYDKESDCYVWYNTDVAPNLWQYWYEGVSSKYSDYGWMEHEDDGWYIEVKGGDWRRISVDRDLWYIEER